MGLFSVLLPLCIRCSRPENGLLHIDMECNPYHIISIKSGHMCSYYILVNVLPENVRVRRQYITLKHKKKHYTYYTVLLHMTTHDNLEEKSVSHHFDSRP